MNTNIEVLRELDELVEAARLLGVTQAKPRRTSMDRYEKNRKELSHEIWAAAQLAPGEGIVDGVARIEALLRRAIHSAITHCDRCGCSWLDDGVNPIGCPYCEHIDWRAVNTELLPLPVGEASSFGDYEVHDNEAMVAYARANIARAVAPLQAEIEALRAEVERLRAMTAMTMGIGRGDGNLFVHGDYDSIKVAQSLVFRAERMRKALKDIRSLSSINPNSFALTVLLANIHHIADTALANNND